MHEYIYVFVCMCIHVYVCVCMCVYEIAVQRLVWPILRAYKPDCILIR